MLSFGKALKDTREKAGVRQKDLASAVIKENGIPISAAYLNDLEHDRRQPPSDHLIEQLAAALNLPDANYFYYLANRLPPTFRALPQADISNITEAFRAFTTVVKNNST